MYHILNVPHAVPTCCVLCCAQDVTVMMELFKHLDIFLAGRRCQLKY